MPKVRVVFDDEWRAKRVFEKTKKIQSSTGAYRLKNKFKNYFNNGSKNTEVLVKITGSSSSFEKMKSHLKYISRNGELELISSDGEIYKGKDELKEACESYDRFVKIPRQSEINKLGLKEKRETINLVFSMKDHSLAPTNKIKIAAIRAIKNYYPENHFLLAAHNDTDNPHCHICLKMTDNFGKRINPNKNDLADLRKSFALELNKLGVEAKATMRQRSYSLNKEEAKQHYYEIVSFGEANYKFQDDAEPSYYVKYKTKNGKIVDIWSKDLERVIIENKIHVGERARFAITGEEPVVVSFRNRVKKVDDKGKTYYEYENAKKISYRKTWDVSVLGRAEKELKPLIKFSKPHYEIERLGKVANEPQDNHMSSNNKESISLGLEVGSRPDIHR